MEVELHSDDGTEVAGYRLCKCGRLTIEYVFFSCGAQCLTCFQEGKTRNIRIAEVIHAGRRSTLRIPNQTPWKAKKKHPTAGTKQAAKAKLVAMKRLARLYPEMFDMLVAEERLRRGLPPTVHSTQGTTLIEASETYVWDAVYAALTNQGVDTDGLQ